MKICASYEIIIPTVIAYNRIQIAHSTAPTSGTQREGLLGCLFLSSLAWPVGCTTAHRRGLQEVFSMGKMGIPNSHSLCNLL